MSKALSQFEVGEKFVSAPKIVTVSDIELFCSITRGNLSLFLRDDFAQSLGWERRLSPGALNSAICTGLIEEAGLLDNVMAYLGVDKIRFTHPVYPGDSITVYVELLSKRMTKAADRGLVTYKWEGKNQRDEIVVSGENVCMFKVPFPVAIESARR